jgi:hypothetical protein
MSRFMQLRMHTKGRTRPSWQRHSSPAETLVWLATWGGCQPQTISLRLEHQYDYTWTITLRLEKRSVLDSLNDAYTETTRYEIHIEGSTRLRSASCILDQCGHTFVTVHNCAHRYIIEWYYYLFFPMALRPNAGHGLLILEVSRSHTTHQSAGLLWRSDQLVVVQTSTWQHQHSKRTDIQAPSGIRTHSPKKRAAADLRLKPRGYWNRHYYY